MTPDVALAVARLSALLEEPPDPARVLGLVFEGVPVAKERARWSPQNQRWYTPSKTEDAEDALAWAFKAALAKTGATLDAEEYAAIEPTLQIAAS